VADDADAAARVIERLLADAAFRAEFRRAPATACREAGLDELAEYMAYGAGKAMHTLDVRESRSSLAGVMMAAALEGIGVFEFAEHIVPGAIAAPGAARDVLSRVKLPKVDGAMGLRGVLAPSPGVASAAGAEDAAVDAGAAPAPVQVAAAPAPPVEPQGGAAPAAEPQGATHAGSQGTAQAEPQGTAQAEPQGAGAAAAAPQGAAAPIDPTQFGAEGSGGAPTPAALALLENKNVVLDQDGIADIKAGRIDPRVIAVLTKLSEEHRISVSCMCSDHPALTTGGSVSNHHLGRGMDIAAIDGMPVNAANPLAREIATELGSLDPSYRPDEIGTPWAISGSGYFTDADHSDHIHVAFKQAIDRSWTPPPDQGGAGAAAAGAGVRAGAGLPAGAGAVAGAPAGAAGGSTLSLGVPREARAARVGGHTLVFRSAQPGSSAASAPGVAGPVRPAPVAGALADHLVAGQAGTPGAGAAALAALAEAMKYKGTPYRWGGSDPHTGFDCSGLVQWAYAKQGIQTGRTTYDQIDSPHGTKVDRRDLVPGDLVFFESASGDVHHVGISMGGDRFLHAPHTGDVVKVSSLDEPYYAQQFAGGRRFDAAAPGVPAAAPAPAAVDAAGAALARDAAEVSNPHSMIFKALTKQEASHHSSTVRFMRAVRPDEVQPGGPQFQRVAAAALPFDPTAAGAALPYPGDGATKEQLAAWLAAQAQQAGLPPELPVMAALVESGLSNLPGGDADSAGFFQMRVGIWNDGEYAGYRERPELQAKWFIDQALAVRKARVAAGDAGFGQDPSTWGNWIADVERPAEQFRGRYALQLEQASRLLGRRV
jgi:cell wall-associated NlpC family hydrolase